MSTAPLTPAQLDELGAELHKLGRREGELEDLLRDLRKQARQAGLAGDFDEADRAWALFEKLKTELPGLQTQITMIERRLYGARRSLRQ